MYYSAEQIKGCDLNPGVTNILANMWGESAAAPCNLYTIWLTQSLTEGGRFRRTRESSNNDI